MTTAITETTPDTSSISPDWIALVREKVETLLPYLEQVVAEGMITMEYVAIVAYRHDPADAPPAPPAPPG